jgi:hypothetical protein
MGHQEHSVMPSDAEKRSGFMYIMGYLATGLAAITTAGVGAAIVLSLPDIRRYLQISSM